MSSREEQEEENKNLDVMVENEEFDDDDEDEESESDDDGDDDESDDDIEGNNDDDVTENADEDVSEEDDDNEDDDDDDAEDDSEDDEGEDEQEDAGNAEDSSSDDENCDRCPICLNRLRAQDVGTPESCDHSFCLECIQEWAKNVNTCPVDRQVFRIILARHAGEEKIFKQFPVEDSHQEAEEAEDDPTYCEVCGHSDREDRLLLCDRCDLGYHCDCLDPPLASVPVHEWFCPDCQQSRTTADTEHYASGRQIARTRVSERVRRLIAEARAERAERRRRVAEMIVAQEALEGTEPAVEPSTSAATTRRTTTTATRKRRTPKKKTGRKRRKTTKKRKTKRKSTGKKTKTKKRRSKGKGKRKVKKKKSVASTTTLARTAISRAVTSVKGRIADRLGLSKPPAGRSIPMQKLPPSGTRQEGAARTSVDHGPSTLSILGSKDELYMFADQEGEERQPINRPAIPAETLLSRSARSSHKPLSFLPVKRKIVVKETPAVSTPTTSAATVVSGGFDLLGSILQNQDLLHKGSKHVTINRDGSLTAASASPSPFSGSKANLRASASAPLLQASSPGTRSSIDVGTSAVRSPGHDSKSATSSFSVKSSPSRMASLSNTTESSTEPPVSLEAAKETKMTTYAASFVSTEMESKNMATVKTDTANLVLAEGESEILSTVNTYSASLVSGETQKDLAALQNLDSKNDIFPDVLDSGTKLSCLSMDISNDGSQDLGVLKSEVEADACRLSITDGVKHIEDSSENVYSSTASSGSTDQDSKVDFRFAGIHKTEQEGKPLTSSESSSDETDIVKSNNSPSIESRESDTVLNSTINDSPVLDTVDVKSGVDLEADAIFSNNARLNAEEDPGNNSIGFSTPTNSQTNLRNFAAVSSDLNSVHDDCSVGIMKRNFDILVSTSSNLAGYESTEENNIEGYALNPNDREEGEASESSTEGQVKREGRQRTEDDQEEGEIVEEEERAMYPERRNQCADSEDSGGLDVNAMHIEEMEIGTFRKRSMSQNEDNNEGNKKMKVDDGTTTTTTTTNGTDIQEDKVGEENEEEDSEVEDANPKKPAGRSFALSSLLSSLKASDFGTAQENDEMKVTVEAKKKVEVKRERQTLDPKKDDDDDHVAKKEISILDFIGDASAKKFGLETDDGDKERGEGDAGYRRGYSSYSGGNNYGHRDSSSNGDRRRHQWQRDRWNGDGETGKESEDAAPAKSFERRRDSWQEDDSGRQGSRSRDNRSSSQRSDFREHRSSKSYHSRETEKGRRRRDDENNERSGRSRSRSDSPRRKGEKRKKDKNEEKNKHEKRRKTRWNQETEEGDEKGQGKQDTEQKKGNCDGSAVQSNGLSTGVAPEARPVAPDYYQPPQYPQGVTAYPYQRTSMPPLIRPPPPTHAHPQPPTNHPHAQNHTHPPVPPPGMPFSHSAPFGQAAYSQAMQGQQAIQGRSLPLGTQPAQHLQGYPASYYSHPTDVSLRVPPPPPGQRCPPGMYPGGARYPSQLPPAGYSRYPPPVNQVYPQPVPSAAYPPRSAMPGAVPAAVYTPAVAATPAAAAASAYPPQPPQSTPATPAVSHFNYPAVSTKQEPPVAQPVASAKQVAVTPVSGPPPGSTIPEPQKPKEVVKRSPAKDVKPSKSRKPASPPPAAPIKGITTYDKVDSSILLNEVKKGFRQLVEDAVRSALKGAWSGKKITKEEYKDIFKRAVEKVCGSKETVVHQEKIQSLVNAYVAKTRKLRKTQTI